MCSVSIYKMKLSYLILIFTKGVLTIEHDFKGFDDSILFGIDWIGSITPIENSLEGNIDKTKNLLKVTTSNKEKYECYIPEVKAKETTSIEDYDGPSPINLLKTLFAFEICSYRLESYWSYEVCHGRYIRQYHEERDGKQVKTQVYYLGHWSPEKQAQLEDAIRVSSEKKEAPKTTKVEGVDLPSVELIMDDGTMCDLNNKPRMTRVRYVCYKYGKHEVHSFKETATCEYEIIILSQLLCEHPQFKPKEISENTIRCASDEFSPKKPQGLMKMEAESLKFQYQALKISQSDKNAKDVLAVLKVEKIDKDGETHLKFELHPLNDEQDSTEGSTKPPAIDKPVAINDDSPVLAFLKGEECLIGGTGWWKYEFCYGKQVSQFHIDRSGERTNLVLGKFDEQAHLDWIKENKGKAPRPIDQRTSISHFYSEGDICDKTGKRRQTEVKLKCLENASTNAHVSLYLLEPKTCHYILGVESPLICNILPLADENGLVKENKYAHTDATDKIEDIDLLDKNVILVGND